MQPAPDPKYRHGNGRCKHLRYKQGAPLDLLWDEALGQMTASEHQSARPVADDIVAPRALLVHVRNGFSVITKVRGHHYIKKNGPVLGGEGGGGTISWCEAVA